MTKQEVNVLERYDPRLSSTRPESVVISENGKIWVKGEIVGEGVFAGQPACVALTVKNHSAKKVSGCGRNTKGIAHARHSGRTQDSP